MDVVLDVLTAYPDTARMASSLIGVAAAGGLAYRLVTTWTQLPVLSHALALVLAAFSATGILAQSRAAALDAPPNEFTLVVALCQLSVVAVTIMWPRWLARTHSPFRRTPPTKEPRP